MEERRAHERKALYGAALVRSTSDHAWQAVILLDVSTDGISFIQAHPVGQIGRLEICYARGEKQLFSAVLRVIHVETFVVPFGFRVGAQFVTRSTHLQVAMSELQAVLPV